LELHGLKHLKLRASLQKGRLFLLPHCLDSLDLLCGLLLAECEGRHSSEMPIKVCLKCGRLFNVFGLEGEARTRKAYCSAKCRRTAWWTPEKRSDDEYIRRLAVLAGRCSKGVDGYSITDLREQLEKPKVKHRLEKIEWRWKAEWPQIVEKIASIKRLRSGGDQPARLAKRGGETDVPSSA
jgi:hypothetical protein